MRRKRLKICNYQAHAVLPFDHVLHYVVPAKLHAMIDCSALKKVKRQKYWHWHIELLLYICFCSAKRFIMHS